MGAPYLSEIRLFSISFPPKGWALCNGQFLPINQNQALFALLGTMYGGNGQTTFQLPDLRDRVPAHVGPFPFEQGARFGAEAHTVTLSELPQHVHLAQGTRADATTRVPTGARLAGANNLYAEPGAAPTTLAPATVTSVGGSQAHLNKMPTLTLTFCIALQGIFPSRN